MDDSEIQAAIAAARRGDADAFRPLVRHFGLGLRAFLASQLHHLDDADDLAQEVFIAAYENLDRFRSGENFAAWLRGIARNKLLNYFRSHARREGALERFRREVTELIETDLEAAIAEMREESIERLLKCISDLPERMRHIVRSGLAGRRALETCTELGMSTGAVYTMNHRANQLLRQCMERTEP